MSLFHTAFMACLIFLVLPMPIESKIIYLFMGFSVFWMLVTAVMLIHTYFAVSDILMSINSIKSKVQEVTDEQ